ILSGRVCECPVAKAHFLLCSVVYSVIAGILIDFTFTFKASDEDNGDLSILLIINIHGVVPSLVSFPLFFGLSFICTHSTKLSWVTRTGHNHHPPAGGLLHSACIHFLCYGSLSIH
ncbi:hypothetical protein CR513_37617, partial [Mucuna pruriens]